MNRQPKQQNNPTIELEKTLLTKGYTRIVGIDEAGRGPWAGPVAVAAYEFDPSVPILSKVKDSKLISAKIREQIFPLFPVKNYHYRIGSVKDIDRLGINKVITNLIHELILIYKNMPNTYFIIDGVFKEDFGPNTSKLIKGDRKHYTISCASIVAKVLRDRLMLCLDDFMPEYGFKVHKGYGTKMHSEALRKYGVSPCHRHSYAPIRSLLTASS
jgi:ribonuclease HII